MGKNALLEAPIGSDPTTATGYHAPMDGNGPLRQQVSAPHQWHQPYPPAAPAPAPSRRWMPVAIISAALIIAAGLVGGAVIMNHNNKTDSAATADGQPAAVTAAADTSTCQAWETTRTALRQIPPLPAGYDWTTPNIDTLIANRNAATAGVLDQFTPKIAAQPSEVTEAANQYVAAKRQEITKLADHSLTSADAEVGNRALNRLNLICGMAE